MPDREDGNGEPIPLRLTPVVSALIDHGKQTECVALPRCLTTTASQFLLSIEYFPVYAKPSAFHPDRNLQPAGQCSTSPPRGTAERCVSGSAPAPRTSPRGAVTGNDIGGKSVISLWHAGGHPACVSLPSTPPHSHFFPPPTTLTSGRYQLHLVSNFSWPNQLRSQDGGF